MLFDALRVSEFTCEYLSLSHNKQMDDDCLKAFCEYTNNNNYIKVIGLCGIEISDTGVEQLVALLDKNSSLTHLYLDGNKKITANSKAAILKIIEVTQLQHIGISNTSINDWNFHFVSLILNVLKYGKSKINVKDG